MKLDVSLEVGGIVTSVSLGFSQEKVAELSGSHLCDSSGGDIEDVLYRLVIRPSSAEAIDMLAQVNYMLAGNLANAVADCQVAFLDSSAK